MNYILVGRHGILSMRLLHKWLEEENFELTLIKKLSEKESKLKNGSKYSISYKGKTNFVSNIELNEDDILIRWGSRAFDGLSENNAKVINTSDSIKKCSNKSDFRVELMKSGVLTPLTVTKFQDLKNLDYTTGIVMRPENHRAGKRFYMADDIDGARKIYYKYFTLKEKFYASEYIDKIAEYRVHYAFGKIILIKEKPAPEENVKGPWNFAVNEDEWKYINWGDWPIKMVKNVVKAGKKLELDMAAFDVMEDKNGLFYIIEANTTPTLTAYSINRYAALFKKIFNNDIDIEENLKIDSDNPKDYVWKNKHLEINKQKNEN